GLLPHEYSLSQNYPNPFNPVTTIQYSLPQRSDVQITIYDLLGKEVITLISETQDAGYKSIQWNASNVPSGMYFYQIKAGTYVQTKKMVLLK
ncbi:MAG: T9SS type A sorting domain-containing protein, partial [Armatimonadetes bacterium]|nr:T9SS type A sorting domain-containing protein [Armatimonadota bacterium]